ncbi:MAG: hypothetical protein U0941_24855 [Planctomycetaceae bacterium]
MNTKTILVSSVLIVACLTGGIQRSSYIGSIKTEDGEFLAEKDGRLVLVKKPERNQINGLSLRGSWKVNTPYIESGGKFLTQEQTEQGVNLSLGEKGDSARWGIEILKIKSLESDGKNRIGSSGALFRLRVVEGRYKGWYIAANEPSEELKTTSNASSIREFRVVENPKMALTFDFIDTHYSVIHK